MKLLLSFIITSMVACPLYADAIYKKELETFKTRKEYKPIFDEDAPLDLKMIHRDIQNYKELTYVQRLARFGVMGLDVVVVTHEAMPALYEYVKTLCEEQEMPMPTVLITRETSIFNAFAFKFLGSNGAIVICQKFLKETSDQELEATIAHELGHIKYNHVNKALALRLASYIGVRSLTNTCAPAYKNYFWTQIILASYLSRLIIGKKFEEQADEFAFNATHDNGQGLVELFEHFERKQNYHNNYFAITYDALQANKAKLSFSDYLSLMTDYYMSKGIHTVNHWLNDNTPLGTHPKPQDRIKAVHRYRTASN